MKKVSKKSKIRVKRRKYAMLLNLKALILESLCKNNLADQLKIVDAYLAQGKDEFSLVLGIYPVELPKIYAQRPELAKYFISGIYDLGVCQEIPFNVVFPMATVPCNKRIAYTYVLYTLQRKRPKTFRIFHGRSEDNEKTFLRYPGILPDAAEFAPYYSALEEWINFSKKSAILDGRTNEVPYSEFNPSHLLPFYYTKAVMKYRLAFRKQKVVRLKDLVEFFRGAENKSSALQMGKPVKLIHPGVCIDRLDATKVPLTKYPYYAENPVEAKNGDLLWNIAGFGIRCYAITNKGSDPLYIDEHMLGMRVISDLVTPEYLYLYMKSDLAKSVLQPLRGWNERKDIEHELAEIPVILPTGSVPMAKDAQKVETYRNIFNVVYGTLNEKADIDKYALAKGYATKGELDDAILQEYQKKVSKIQDDDVQEYIRSNQSEMDITAKDNACQATLVLAGSILETFLIDWASVLDGKDYFRDPFNRDKQEMRLNEAIDYLAKRIKDETGREWKERSIAHEIKRLRNNIHPNVFLREKIKATPEDCHNACLWLKQIMQSRGSVELSELE